MPACASNSNNYGNWQWAAGTGNDTRPGRGYPAPIIEI
jgi:deoxyribodipyrimidine photolyase